MRNQYLNFELKSKRLAAIVSSRKHRLFINNLISNSVVSEFNAERLAAYKLITSKCDLHLCF